MLIISLIIVVGGLAMFLWQLFSGVAMAGLGHFIEREKRPAQYWFMMGIEAIAVIVGVLAFFAFKR